ncbi:MAG: hypothetical protein J7M38_12590 [Armatimonadetes bacterium]|nr:hypothetical protein [Armatimonadota bacterium]
MRLYIALALMLAATALPADEVHRGVSPAVAAENAEPGAEVFRIRIINAAGGAIEVSRDRGASWLRVGSVTAPAAAVNPKGYTASRWARDSSVCATAVNAIHIKVAANPDTGRGIIFSLTPAGPVTGAAVGHGSSSIATDLRPGDAIFGGGLAPTVDSPVRVEIGGALISLAPDFSPGEGDAIVIIVPAPPTAVTQVVFENRTGGDISLRYSDGREKVIGAVLRPVTGVGRFPATKDAAAGRLRVNHAGVIGVSTSPLGLVGGFQIIPRGHAASPEMSYVATTTQWMIVGPRNPQEPSWEGIAPLFARYLAPSYRPDDIFGGHADWMRRLLSRCLAQARIGGGEWRSMPRIVIDPDAPERSAHDSAVRRIRGSLNPYVPLPREAYSALADMTHLRILLPAAQYWPED